MATTEETISILKINAVDAVKTIGGLQENIKNLKDYLKTLEIGTEDYADTLVELQTNQAALKNAMHDTTYAAEGESNAFEQNAKQAQGLGNSYNALVRRMADLDQQFRSTEDATKRANIGAQIKDINEELKRLDAERGKFGRNVGNYASALTGISDVLNNMPPTLGKVATQTKAVGASLRLVGSQPVLGIIGLLAPIIVKITSALKDNDTALGAVKRGMEALQPVFDFFEKILDKIAGWFSQVVDWLVEFAGQHKEAFKTFISGAVGVGNAVKEFLLIPVRNAIDAVKGLGNVFKLVFKGQFKEAASAAKDAVKEIGDNIKQGFSFKANFETGKAVGEAFIAGLGSTKKKAADTAKEIKEAVIREFTDLTIEGDRLALQTIATSNKVTGVISRNLDEIMAKNRAAYEDEQLLNKERIESYYGYAAAVSNVLGTLADMYEMNGEEDAKGAAKAKALRTASAIVSTISGAISAYMNTIESIKHPAVAIPLAIANAATVLAAGMAQVKKINAVKIPGGQGSSVPALASAPSVAPAISQVRTITGRTEEERLNQMASDQRVYIVYSDIEAAQRGQRVRVAEAAF